MLSDKMRAKIACNCHNVTYGKVYDAVKNGARTVEEVSQATKAATGCGKCKGFLECLVRDFAEDLE